MQARSARVTGVRSYCAASQRPHTTAHPLDTLLHTIAGTKEMMEPPITILCTHVPTIPMHSAVSSHTQKRDTVHAYAELDGFPNKTMQVHVALRTQLVDIRAQQKDESNKGISVVSHSVHTVARFAQQSHNANSRHVSPGYISAGSRNAEGCEQACHSSTPKSLAPAGKPSESSHLLLRQPTIPSSGST